MTRKYPPQPRKSLSAEELMAMRLQRQAEAERALREHAADQEAFHKNRERLKAERLAREAHSRPEVVASTTAPRNR